MSAIQLLSRSRVLRTQDLDYELEFIEVQKPSIGHCRTELEIQGRIHYIFNGRRSGMMTHGNERDTRASWHRLCRVRRAKAAGRDYLKLINHMDARERRVLGHPPLTQ
jgi:hypothetical protein